jgi:hypothetical protein
MLKNINVRFFVVTYNEYAGLDVMEIDHQEFVDRFADHPEARVDVELHDIFTNGVRQLCITLNEVTA